MSTQQKTQAPDEPENITDAIREKRRQVVKDAAKAIIALKDRRKKLNRDITAERNKVKKEGINIEAFNMAVTQYELDEAKRNSQQRDFIQCCQALDIGCQLVMDFSVADQANKLGPDAALESIADEILDIPAGEEDTADAGIDLDLVDGEEDEDDGADDPDGAETEGLDDDGDDLEDFANQRGVEVVHRD